MKKTETLYVTTRDDWRVWLKKNHKTKKEIWLIYYKKHTGKPSIPYDDSVEEALCFGWIDSILKRLDDEKFARKFTPRKDKSKWSALNIKRAQKMIKQGRMTKVGLTIYKEIEQTADKILKAKQIKDKLTVPPELKKALTQNKKALENFKNFASSYKRMYIGWIASAKRQETRERRIKQVVEWAAQNKKPGML